LPGGALFYTEIRSRVRIGVWLPPAVRSITFASGRRPQAWRVPLPGCVFVGEGVRYSIYAAVNRPTQESSPLCLMPLPNVHGNGSICAGSVQFPVCSAETIHAAAALFFESEFNHDLAGGKITTARAPRPTRGRRLNLPFYDGEAEFDDENGEEDEDGEEESGADGAELIELLRSLDGKRAFPVARLMRSSRPDTLGDVMKE
jgi:hypothetical protein